MSHVKILSHALVVSKHYLFHQLKIFESCIKRMYKFLMTVNRSQLALTKCDGQDF